MSISVQATSKEKQRSKPDVSKVLQSARGAHYERRLATLQDSAGAASQLQRSDFARTAIEVRFEDCLSPAELQEWRAYTSTLEQLTHAGGSRPEASAALAALAGEQQAEPGPALPIRRMLASLEKRGSSKSLAPPPAAAAAAAAKEVQAPSPLPLGPFVSEAGPGSPTSSRPGVKFKTQPAEQAAEQAADEDKAEQQPSRFKLSERRSLLTATHTSSSRRHSLAGNDLACGPAAMSAPPYHRFSTSSLSQPSTTSTTSTTLKDRPTNCISTSPHVPPATSKGTGISPPQLTLVEDTGTPLPSPLTSPSAPAALASPSGCSSTSAAPHSLPGAQPPAGSSASSTRGAVTRIEQQSAAAHATFMRLVLGGGSQGSLSPLGRHSQASQVSLGHQRHSGHLPTVPAAAAAAGGEGASGLPPQHTAGAARLAAGSGQARSDAQKAGGGPAAAGPGAATGGRADGGGGGGEGGGGGGMGGGGSGGHSTTSSSPSFRRSHTNSLPMASWLDPGPAHDSRPGAKAGGRGEGEGGAAGSGGPGRSSGPEAQQPALSHMRRQPRRTASQLGRLLSDCLQAPPLSTTSTQGPDWASLGTILPCSPSSGVSSTLPLLPSDACPLLPLAAHPHRRPSCQVPGQGDSLDAFAAGQAAHSQPGYGLLNSSSSSRATAAVSCGGAGSPVGRQAPGSARVMLGQGSGAGASQGDCQAGARAGRDSQAAAPPWGAGKAGVVEEQEQGQGQGQGQTPQQQQQQQPRQAAQAPVTWGYAALLRG